MGLDRRSGPLLSLVLLAITLILTSGCSQAADAVLLTGTPTELPPTKTPVPAATLTPTPTVTPYPTPTVRPTPLPTIIIPMLTRTAPLVTTPQPRPEQWHLPERVVPEGFGVEIHFTRTSRQELDYLASGGFKWVRMDLFWHTIEKERGRYDFSEYDALVQSMTARGIRIVFILDYGNALYDHGFPPTSPGGQAAFARFAAVAASRYRDKGIIWDIWNEPNLDHFWQPEANASDYGRLALRTIAAIRRADPTALIAGPALAGFNWNYWHTLGQMGMFKRVDALTVHAYGVYEPETLIGPYLDLRALINTYSPMHKVPILSGEWGFATAEGGMPEVQQAQYLARQWLFNISHDLNLSIWYDWHDDGTEPQNPEHHFGVVRNDYTAKPSFRAARTLAETLNGYRFLRRVPLGNPTDYLLLFQKGEQVAMAIWTAGGAHTVRLPLPVYEVEIVEMTGDRNIVTNDEATLALSVSQSPRYLLFRPDQVASQIGDWRPEDTINCYTAGDAATLPVIFERYQQGEFYGELQVWAQGQMIGAAPVAVPALARQGVSVPLDLTGLTGNVQATVRLTTEDTTLSELQAAIIWLQIAAP